MVGVEFPQVETRSVRAGQYQAVPEGEQKRFFLVGVMDGTQSPSCNPREVLVGCVDPWEVRAKVEHVNFAARGVLFYVVPWHISPDFHFSFRSANHRVASDAFIYAGWKALKALRRATPNG